MSGDNFDPCECIFSHENTMQRLLNMLRQSQNYCNDVVCQDGPPNEIARQDNGGLPTAYLLLFAWLLATLGLFAFRSATGYSETNKPRPSGGQGRDPPAIS